MSGPKTREPLRVGIAGLGAVGLEVAKRLPQHAPNRPSDETFAVADTHQDRDAIIVRWHI